MKGSPIILILAIITIVFIFAGAAIIEISQPHGTPQERIANDPDVISACQSEYWTNTSHEGIINTRDGSERATLTTLYRVCYYRDGNVTITSLGDYTSDASAFVADVYFHHGSTKTQVIK